MHHVFIGFEMLVMLKQATGARHWMGSSAMQHGTQTQANKVMIHYKADADVMPL